MRSPTSSPIGRNGTRRTAATILAAACLASALGACSTGGLSAAPMRSSSPSSAPAPVPAADVAAEPSPDVAREAAVRAPMTHRTVRERARLPFGRQVVTTDALDRGVLKVKQTGSPGVRVKVYRLDLREGRTVHRHQLRTNVLRQPVPRIVLRGTHVDPPPAPTPAPAPPKVSASCDSNYAGACVPIASDVDCGGGSGNGPAYVYATVRVVGSDIYGLDSDGDGYGCE